MRRGIMVAWVAVALGGCGLVYDFQPQPDGSTPDAGAMDATVVTPTCARDADCAPGDACRGAERCVEGRCLPSDTQLDCDDRIPCTLDGCDPVTGCTHVPDRSACGAPFGADDCRTRACDPGQGCVVVPKDGFCGDGIACTFDRCALEPGDGAEAGECVRQPVDALCRRSVGEASRCEPDASLDASGCTPIECNRPEDCPVDGACTASNACVAGSCVRTTDADGVSCDDDVPCSEASACSGGICVPTVPFDCDDGNPCTQDHCDGSSGSPVCRSDPDPARDGRLCTPDAPCRTGACAAGVCEASGDLCTSDPSTCMASSCVGGSCVGSNPCVAQRRTCLGDVSGDGVGDCGACMPGYADCGGGPTCECAAADGCFCTPPDASTPGPDAGASDAGSSSDAGVDAGVVVPDEAGVPRDSGSYYPDGGCARLRDGMGRCPAGWMACGASLCCDCPSAEAVCEIGGCVFTM